MIISEEKTWKPIHSAYGVDLKGQFGVYNSPFDGNRDVIVAISVNGRELYLGNNFINAHHEEGVINMEDDKDLLCFMFSRREKEMDDWEFDRFFTKEYFHTLWRSKARDRKLLEEMEKAEAEVAKIKQLKREQSIAECKVYAEKKKLRLIIDHDNAYFVKIDRKRHKNADDVPDQTILDFIEKYPGNGVEIVETRKIA